MLINEQERTGLSPLLERAATIRLEEEMFSQARQRGLDLTGYLEELDPSRPESALDAFERQLALAGIRVSGSGSDIIDRFFSTKAQLLVDESVPADKIIGIDNRFALEEVYETSVLDEGDLQLARAGEGAALPKIELKTAEHSIQIYKFGRYLETSYEAIRRRKAAVVSIFLKAIGVQLQKDKFAAAIDVIVSGDGNSNAATVQSTAGATLPGFRSL